MSESTLISNREEIIGIITAITGSWLTFLRLTPDF
jgi:hypothetical protein